MRRITRAIPVAVTATAALLLVTTPAVAGPVKPAPTKLVVTVGPSQANPVPTSVLLTCDPAGGDHANAKAACADLEAVDGDIAAVPPRMVACTAHIDPVEISVTGVWRGREISFAQAMKGSNPRCARFAHGYVFSID